MGNWHDGEIRKAYVANSKDIEYSLALLPTGDDGTLTMVLSARIGQPVHELPNTIQVRIGAGIHINPMIRRRTLVFVVNRDGLTTTVDASERLRLLDPSPGAALENGYAEISLTEFRSIIRAQGIKATIFGIDFSLTTKQTAALHEFGRLVENSR